MSQETKWATMKDLYVNYLEALSLLNDAWLAIGAVDKQPMQFGSCSLVGFSKQVRDYKLRLKLERKLTID